MSLTRSPILTRNRELINLNQNMDPPLQPLPQPLQPPQQNENVGLTTLKLPPFYNKYPYQWFTFAEAQLSIKNILLENTKYEHLILSLSQDLFATVFDVIQYINDNWNDPQSTPYTTLKEALLERNSLSESQRLESLLKDLDMGDRKPSEFFRTLKQTAGQSDSISEKLIIQLWIRKLPTQIQVSLKTLPNPDIKTLINMADSICEIIQTSNQGHIQAVTSPFEQFQNEQITRLENQVKLLTESVQKLSLNTNKHHSSYRTRSRSRSNSRKSPPNSTELCWYHSKFATKAKKCIPPCNFLKNQ